MKTLAKRPREDLAEVGVNSACQTFNTVWNPDYGIPYWAIWSKSGPQKSAIAHLRHLPDAVMATPVITHAAERELFNQLASEWEVETEFTSRQSQSVLHPAYQRIIGLGPAAIPLLLERLRDAPDNWFWALVAITGEDAGEGTTTLADARQAWLDWGQQQGYIA